LLNLAASRWRHEWLADRARALSASATSSCSRYKGDGKEREGKGYGLGRGGRGWKGRALRAVEERVEKGEHK